MRLAIYLIYLFLLLFIVSIYLLTIRIHFIKRKTPCQLYTLTHNTTFIYLQFHREHIILVTSLCSLQRNGCRAWNAWVYVNVSSCYFSCVGDCAHNLHGLFGYLPSGGLLSQPHPIITRENLQLIPQSHVL